jgi:uncharacterized repeat protein (TIGR02543 family)
VRVHKFLVVLTILALVLGSADLADAKKKRKKKKKNSVPTTLVIESAAVGGTHIAGTLESSREGCVDERKVSVTYNGDPVGSADADSEGQWFIDGSKTIKNGDRIQAAVEKVVIKSKNKKITCGSDSDRFVAGQDDNDGDTGGNNGGQEGTETLTVTVAGPGTVTSNPPGINCRQASGTCERDFPEDSTVSLTATPDTDATFTGWSGACSGTTQPCNVTMDTDRTVGATFEGAGAAPCPIPDTVPEPLRGVLCLVVELLGG